MKTITLKFMVDGLQNILCIPLQLDTAEIEVSYEVTGRNTFATLLDPQEYLEYELLLDDIIVSKIDNWTPNPKQDKLVIAWLQKVGTDFIDVALTKCIEHHEQARRN